MIRASHLNGLSPAEALRELTQCCGARQWAEAMVARRPFVSEAAVLDASAACFAALTDDDWREAFRHHPKIGDLGSLRLKFAGQEQGGVAAAPEATLSALAAGNRAYEDRHGFIFIVCATGKSAGEMLALLMARTFNDTATELRHAAAEQRKITALRLEKL